LIIDYGLLIVGLCMATSPKGSSGGRAGEVTGSNVKNINGMPEDMPRCQTKSLDESGLN
jgi:hypothetical protein